MHVWQETYEFNRKIIFLISKICQPLQINFDFNLITYRRFYNDGKMLYLFNHQEWMKFVLEKEFWVTTKFQEKIKFINKSASIHSIWDEKYLEKDKIYKALFEYNIWNGISIYKKFEHFIEAFAFATTKENTSILNFYIENMEMIEHFILYFREQISSIIRKIDPHILIPFEISPLISEKKTISGIGSFFESTPLNRVTLNINGFDCSLSRREMECLIPTIKGKTSKEIARMLSLSPRSVEKYIDNIKMKLHCDSRGQMMEKIFQCSDIRSLLFNEHFS